jgi:hypothetical protein
MIAPRAWRQPHAALTDGVPVADAGHAARLLIDFAPVVILLRDGGGERPRLHPDDVVALRSSDLATLLDTRRRHPEGDAA